MSIAIGDAFLVKGGSNSHGAGTQIALVRKITKQGNVYCFKISKRTASVVARNYRLETDHVIEAVDFNKWIAHQQHPKGARLVRQLAEITENEKQGDT